MEQTTAGWDVSVPPGPGAPAQWANSGASARHRCTGTGISQSAGSSRSVLNWYEGEQRAGFVPGAWPWFFWSWVGLLLKFTGDTRSSLLTHWSRYIIGVVFMSVAEDSSYKVKIYYSHSHVLFTSSFPQREVQFRDIELQRVARFLQGHFPAQTINFSLKVSLLKTTNTDKYFPAVLSHDVQACLQEMSWRLRDGVQNATTAEHTLVTSLDIYRWFLKKKKNWFDNRTAN